MTTDVEVSVIIPTYNRASTIERALASALSQSRPPVEVIIVDDGSTDRTAELLATIDAPEVRVVSQENAGVCAARNVGARVARGSHLYFLDSDDEARPTALATLVGLLVHPRADLASGAVRFREPDGRTRLRAPGGQPRPAFADTALLLAGSFVVDREWFLQVGGYDDQLRFSEHTDLRMRFATAIGTGRRSERSTDQEVLLVHRRAGRHNPAIRLESAKRLLAQHPERFGKDPELTATYLSIAGVSADSIGAHREAVWLHWRAWRQTPSNAKPLLRMARSVARASARTLLWKSDPSLRSPGAGLR